MEPIAIVGSACRFPGGASSPSKLWDLLRDPRDVLREFKSSAIRPNLDSFYSTNGEQAGRVEVESKAYILEEDPTIFDAAFFNISPLEAMGMDPQQRILLETVYESLEAAGYPLHRVQGAPVAVFAGSMTNDYYDMQVRDPETMPRYNATGTTRSILANRISYVFDLKGPSLTVDTACSSSLVCVHLAVQSLRNGECDSAIVAGSNLILDPCMFQAESSLHMLSADSRSRMWDSAANGYARGEGFASLVLKPLSRALRDGDHVECVIRHTAVNSDGRTKGITMPSPSAQTAMIRRAYLDSGLDPVVDRPQFFECHGTGTLAGDPVEAEAVYDAFFPEDADDKASKLLVGSIKTVIGHLEGCAGIAGVLKASLAIQNRTIPPNMHFNELNPAITPFYGRLEIPTTARPWPAVEKGPLRASVNSFGFGGTNAHVILENLEQSAVPNGKQETSDGVEASGPFLLSAQTELSLSGAVTQLVEHLEAYPNLNLSDLSAQLQLRRSVFPLKTFFSASNREELVESMRQHLAEVESGRKPIGLNPKLVSQPPEVPGTLGIFTGQGAQWPAMGAGLLRISSVFRKAIQDCEHSLATCPDPPSWSLQTELAVPGPQSRVSEAALSQPLCTAVQIGLVNLLTESGIKLDAVVGHSSGEIAAVYAAGIISATDAIRIAYYRGLYASLARGSEGQRGAMLAAAIPHDAAIDFCQEGADVGRIAVAASNSPSSVTLSGDADAIERAKAHFDKHKIFARPLRVDTAYHSHHMAPCAGPYREALKRCNIAIHEPRPDCVWISSVHGDVSLLNDGDLEPLRAEYWVQNMVQPVLFSQALQTSLWAGGPFDMVIEVGCHPALKGPASQTFHTLLGATLPYAGVMSRGEDDRRTFASGVGLVWQTLGPAAVDFAGYNRALSSSSPSSARIIKNLPPYPWDHTKPYWRESRISRRYRLPPSPAPPHPLLGRRVPDDSDTEMRWRHVLRLADLPWLRGHVFQGQAIFPAAGYVSMALAAGMALARAAGKQVRLVEVLGLTMSRALVVEEGHAGVEVVFSASRVNVNSSAAREEDVIEARVTCQICADEAAGELVQNCAGRVRVYLGEANSGRGPLGVQAGGRRSKLRPVDLDAYYESVERLGLDYQDHFRGLVAAERTLGQSRASAAWAQGVDLKLDDVPHPGFLDTGFQSLFIAYGSPTSDQLWAPYLPVEIKRFSYDPHVDYRYAQGANAELEAFVTHGSAKNLVGDVHFFTPAKDGGNCGIQAEGIVLQSFTEPKPANDRLLFTKTVWKSDILGGCVDDELASVAASAPHDPDILEAVSRVALFYFRRLSATIHPDEVAGMKWHHQHLMKVVKLRIDQTRDGTLATAKREWLEDTEDDIAALTQAFPGQIDLELGTALGKSLVDIVRGKTEPLQVMMENDMLDRLYMGGCGFAFVNDFMSQVTSRIVHKHPRMDILEIGAGTGGATRRLLDVIGQSYSTYTYTDISAGFFEKAADKFADHRGSMAFKILDVERRPADQGYEEHSYDLIMASNVLHATKTLKETLTHTRSLLKPGGYLVLAEVTGGLLRLLLLMGTLPGWWLGVDDGRTTGPGSSLLHWDQVLRETGFSGVDISAIDDQDPAIHSFSVIISQALDDDFRLIRDPLSWAGPETSISTTTNSSSQTSPSLVIIGGKTLPTSKLIQQTQRLLPFSRADTTILTDIDAIHSRRHIPPGASVLCLTELDEPIFASALTPEHMHALQTLFGQAAAVLWVTEGRLGGEPLCNMTVGLGRALLEELPELRLQFLDVDKERKGRLRAQEVAEVFVRLLVTVEVEGRGRMGVGNGGGGEKKMLWTLEPELYFDGQAIHVPRIVLDREANDRVNASRRRITREVNLEDEAVEIRQGAGGAALQVRENNKSKTTVQGQSEQVVVRVKYSMQLHADLDSREVLCLGVLEGSNQAVICFAESHASSVRPPSDAVFVIPEPQSRTALDDGPSFLAAVSRQVITAAVVAGLDKDIGLAPAQSSVVVIHGADESLAQVVSRQREGTHFSSSDSDALPRGWLDLGPTRTAHSIERSLPAVSGLFVDLAPDGEISSKLPRTWHVRKHDKYASLHSTRQWTDVVHRAALEYPGHQEVRRVSIESFADSPTSTAPYPAVVDWTNVQKLPVEMTPLDVSRLVHPDKTYLMVGMTSELGLSLCRYLVVHGARHLVLTSRNPSISQDWLDEMARYGATVQVCAADASDMSSLRPVVEKISQTMPSIGGVCNAALLLHDKLFVDMTAEEMQVPFAGKVQGTKNLHALFSESSSAPPLDFFICFSSLGSIAGNAGQSNYHVANLFMAGLAAQRRLKGLAASVIHIGLVVDVGYVARAGRQTENHLRSRFYLPLSEPDIHNMFAEAILASDPTSGRAEIICGMEPSSNAPDAKRTAPWIFNPRFSHMIMAASKGEAQESATSQTVHIRQLMEEASDDPKEALRLLTATFLAKVETMLQLSAGTARADAPLVDHGCDSLLAVEIRAWFLKEINVEVPILKILSGDTIAELCTTVTNNFLAACSGKPKATALDNPEPKPEPSKRTESTGDTESGDHGSASSVSEPETPPSPGSAGITSPDSEVLASQLLLASSHEETPAELDFVRCERMSYAQARLSFLRTYLRDATTFNCALSFRIDGKIRAPRLRDAFQQVLARHESLRTCFFLDPDTGKAMQGVLAEARGSMDVMTDPDAAYADCVYSQYKTRLWQLERGDGIHATLVSHSPDSHTLLLGHHHILMDGIALYLFLNEVGLAYGTSRLPPPGLQPCDFARAELEQVTLEKLSREADFWRAEHAELPEMLPLLPFARVKSRKTCDVWTGNTCGREVSADLFAKIKTACQALRITPFHFYLSVIQVLLCQLLDIDDICIGVTDANRSDDALASAIGFFLNLLPLRLRLGNNKSTRFADIAKTTSAKVLAAYEHSRLPFDLILDAVGAPRSASHSPLFQVAVNYRPVAFTDIPLGGDGKLTLTAHHDARNPYDLAFNVVQTGPKTCLVELTSRDYLYSADSCALLLGMYMDLLKEFANTPLRALDQVQITRAVSGHPESISRGPSVDFGWPGTLVERVDQMARGHASHVAVVDEYQRVTYSELQLLSNRIVASLLDHHLPQGSSVAVLLEPSVATIASILAILRIGCVYVPLDLSIPQARHAAMLADAKAPIIICHAETASLASQLVTPLPNSTSTQLLNLTTSLSPSPPPTTIPNTSTPTTPAFLLYSSGSTGLPKGILLPQRGILNYLASKAQRLGLDSSVLALQHSSTGFDMSLAQTFNGLCHGGTVVVAPRSTRGDPAALAGLMVKEGVSFTIATPSECLLWVRYGGEVLRKGGRWRWACLGGEVVGERLKGELRRLESEGLVVTDCYGPTELSCATSFETVSLAPREQGVLDDFFSVGKPIANTTIIIADKLGNPVPLGFPGEICVGGAGVALGYSNSDALTDEKFVANRFAGPDERGFGLTRMYKTGDCGRLLPDGSLVFMGRLDGDGMVKLRGLRIDLDDVASTLIRTSKGLVADACVTVQGDTDSLVAYVVPANNVVLSTAELHHILKGMELPRYMIPSRAIPLDRLPTSSNGKVDRRALAAMALPVQESEAEAKPRETMSLLEGQLKLLWDEVLGPAPDREPLHRDSDFFMVGGNSHLLVKLKAAIEETQGVAVSLRDLYASSTLASMAAALATELGTQKPVEVNWEEEVASLQADFFSDLATDFTTVSDLSRPRTPRDGDMHVLLTGATTFLGQAILRLLASHPAVSTVHCVAIPPDTDPSTILPNSSSFTASHHHPHTRHLAKIIPYPGTLTHPNLGLTPREFSHLQHRADLILHTAAHGHCLNTYASLRAPNVRATARLAQLARPRGVPLHFLSSNRVTLLSGRTELGAVSVAGWVPGEGAGQGEGFTCGKWVCERLLEVVGGGGDGKERQDGNRVAVPVWIHRACALVGDEAPSHDALNALLRFAVRMRAVPSMKELEGYLDFKSVDEVAADMVADALGGGQSGKKADGVRYRHHSSGVRVPVGKFRERMEELYGGTFEEVEMAAWLERARQMGIEELIVSYLQSLTKKGETMRFPYLGASV